MSKKMVVRFDPKNPKKASSDFLAPFRDESGNVYLASLKNARNASFGLVVYTGREITCNDVFAKLVDSGMKIESVEEKQTDIQSFLTQIAQFKIGDVIEINSEIDGPNTVKLRKAEFGQPEN